MIISDAAWDTPKDENMPEEIDLKYYLTALLRAWWFILLCTVVAAGLAYGISKLLPRQYEAGALVVATSARTTVQFDDRIATQNVQISARGYPDLALSDELRQRLWERVRPQAPAIANLSALTALLDATALTDPALLQLSVTYEDPATAALIANAWAELYVAWANEVYSNTTQEQVAFFEERLLAAETAWQEASAALASFQARNRLATLKQQLDDLLATQALYLLEQRQKTLLLQNIQALQTQLNAQPGNTEAVGEQLTVLFLQLKAFSAEPTASLQLNLDPQEQSFNQSRQELDAILQTLAQSITAQLQTTTQAAARLEPQILSLQVEQQTLQTELDQLLQNEQVTNETYLALAHKVEEERLALQDSDSGFRLASRAAVPQNSVRPLVMLNTLIAFVFGLLGSLLLVVVYAWWRSAPAQVEARERS